MTEPELFNRVKSGDKKAFEKLFEIYYKHLCHFALTFIYNRDDSEDVVQKFFVRLWENRKNLELPSNTKAFLFKSVYFESMKFIRNKNIRLKNQTAFCTHIQINEDDSPEYSAFLPYLYKAIEKLPEKCQQIFILNKLEGLTHKEIAEYLEISVRTVENQVAIAISKLRIELKPFLHLIPATLLFIII